MMPSNTLEQSPLRLGEYKRKKNHGRNQENPNPGSPQPSAPESMGALRSDRGDHEGAFGLQR